MERLDDVAEFADEEGLSDRAFDDLSDAVLRFHDRMESLGPPGPPGDRPSEEDRGRMDESFRLLHDDVRDAVGEELAEAFLEWMRPPPPPGH